MRLEDCFKMRHLRMTHPDNDMSEKALDMAFEKLDRATELHEREFYDESVVSSYSSMFQAARAILFKEGVIEKNHFCVVLYLTEHHSADLGTDLISWLDTYRLERHQWFYGVESLGTNIEESEAAIRRAGDFLEKAEKILALKCEPRSPKG
jgi:uncharacterized protein (UPF0332 family)